MRMLTYLLNFLVWGVLGVVCLILFFPAAIVPFVLWIMSVSRLRHMYKEKDDAKRHSEVMALMREQNQLPR